MSIKQRMGIPGGACEFDLPSYHHWLHLAPAVRRNDLEEWLAPLLPLEEGFSIVLHLLRNSGKTCRHTAHRGVYQQMGSGRVARSGDATGGRAAGQADRRLLCAPAWLSTL